MDPNVTLHELTELMARAQKYMDEDTGHPAFCEVPNYLTRDIITRWEALSGWLERGGFLPAAWQGNRA